MKRKKSIIPAAMLAILLLAAAISTAAPPPISQSEMLSEMEKTLFGKPVDGPILPRVAKLEEIVLAKPGEGNLTGRVEKLWSELGGDKLSVASLGYKVMFAQWIVDGRVGGISLLDKVAALEKTLFGYVSREALPARIGRVIEATSGKGGIDIGYEKLAKGTKLAVTIDTPLSTLKSKPGDTAVITVDEDVIVGSRLAIPAGTSWESKVVAPTKSNKFDLKNLLEIALEPLPALDGTAVRVYVDDEAISATLAQSGLLICQGENADRLGFFTRGSAVDRLLPGNKNLEIAAGTRIVLSVKEDQIISSAKIR